MLTNCSKSSDVTRTNLFLILLSQINGGVVRNWFRADLSSIWDPLTCYLSKRCMKDGLLDI